MKNHKPTILLCWGYHRKGWLHAFKRLNDDFDFHYIFHITKPQNEVNHSGTENLLYWQDYSSAQELLEKVRPEKIVMMGTQAINTTALNIVARKKGIETIVLQHGMFHTYADYLNLAREEIKQRARSKQYETSDAEVDRVFLLKFFLRSIATTAPTAIFYMFKLQYFKRKMLEIEAFKAVRSKFRIPSKYVVFTKHNASIYLERDGASESDLIEIGNPEMDAYFNYEAISKSSEDYFLLIDQPWAEVKDYGSPGFGISKEQTNYFYHKLAKYAESKSAKLKIKLHPYSYKSDFHIKHPNIEYIKDTDIVELIMESSGVFGFNSTLTLPGIYYKNCCLFKIWEDSSFQNTIKDLRLAQVLDYHSFETKDIDLESIIKTDGNIQTFVKKYFYKTDGKAVEGLKALLYSQ